MNTANPQIIHLNDYQVTDFLIDHVFLHFDLQDEYTKVTTVLKMRRNPAATNSSQPLQLTGEDLELKSVQLNGNLLAPEKYQVTKEFLIIPEVPDEFVLETEVWLKPENNTQLSGLYLSRGNYCTQCESRGFRRITYFLDRPDVLTRFTVTITADKDRCPVLLANGNLIEEKTLAHNRHWVKWEDPSFKPCYLFALVAGNFEYLSGRHVTISNRVIELRVYVEQGKREQAHFALEALKQAMTWDEKTYGLEYDLDMYMIVAVNDFNFGAMENKGLNIFNDRYILADGKTATDDDFINVQSVIGHEYFHNWSGNRVTVRDWFQITLKEGLTIFRDQSFSADLNSKVVKRIHDVNVIRTAQFAQDAGPMAHPIRPDHYIEVNNFYTVTVYNKGAEVIRMMQTILGEEKFNQAMRLYFAKHDGTAVTTEEFIRAMEEVSGLDLTQFRRWYTQAGTPTLTIQTHYDPKAQTYSMTVQQSCPPTPDQPKKENFYIPLAVGLLGKDGKDLPLQRAGGKNSSIHTEVLLITQAEEKFVFTHVPAEPVPSLLRNFSAPVKIKYNYTDAELAFLLAHDSDGFNRWDAGQKLAEKVLLQALKTAPQPTKLDSRHPLLDAYRALFADQQLDPALAAEMLMLPRVAYLLELQTPADPIAIYKTREEVKLQLVQTLKAEFLSCYQKHYAPKHYEFSGPAMARRSLQNSCLHYLAQLNNAEVKDLCLQQFHRADNMTDMMGALGSLNSLDCSEREKVLAEFYQHWQQESLVIDKWFALQAIAAFPDALQRVKALLLHPGFNYQNPNRVRALIATFCVANYLGFHQADGSGYEFCAEQVIILDKTNPQTAARIVEPLIHWRKFMPAQQKLMQQQLQHIAVVKNLSKNVYELVNRSLQE